MSRKRMFLTALACTYFGGEGFGVGAPLHFYLTPPLVHCSQTLLHFFPPCNSLSAGTPSSLPLQSCLTLVIAHRMRVFESWPFCMPLNQSLVNSEMQIPGNIRWSSKPIPEQGLYFPLPSPPLFSFSSPLLLLPVSLINQQPATSVPSWRLRREVLEVPFDPALLP